jgi:glycosyltransferase involved in cell wall biosynthesis
MSKISIITVNYNNADGLAQTIASVTSQSHSNFEYIVIDGDSNDGSVTVIEENADLITTWISEKDTGVYEAMNKGIGLAGGNYVLFLNSGDTFISTNVLEEASKKINGSIDIYYGNLMFIGEGKVQLREYPKELRFSYFLKRSLPHPGSFIKRELFDEIFYYSEDFKIASDWEFFLVAICKSGVSYKHLEMVISNFALDGMSNERGNMGKIVEERKKILQKHFPTFYEDALTMEKHQNILNRKDVKLYLEQQYSKMGRKLHIKLMKLLAFFFHTK